MASASYQQVAGFFQGIAVTGSLNLNCRVGGQ
jgi:hypothetical protein